MESEVINMELYRVEKMTQNDYHLYMTGYTSGYDIITELIPADSPEEAIKIASQNGHYVVNEKYVKTPEEIEKDKQERNRRYKEKEKQEKEKRRKIQEEKRLKNIQEANKLGLTVEEYKIERKRKKDIEKIKEEINYLKKALNLKEKLLQELENKN